MAAANGRASPERYGPTRAPDPASPAGKFVAQLAERGRFGLDPASVAAQVLAAIRDGDLYVFTHPEMHYEVRERFAAIEAAMAKSAARLPRG